jgi:dTDP-D-glucose 4,6-dehydratase
MTMPNRINTVLVTGGAGYVGAVLVPKLLAKGYKVKVLDLYLYGEDVFEAVKGNPNLEHIKGDIRDHGLLERVIPVVRPSYTSRAYPTIRASNSILNSASPSTTTLLSTWSKCQSPRRAPVCLRVLVQCLRHQRRSECDRRSGP